ncbi:hypothetical protein [Longimicrobium sp.]|uniref:hypothetical protein n=1 Tax=Longimicrobium sp. TaxID=2029185 RepID=UPI002EDB8330
MSINLPPPPPSSSSRSGCLKIAGIGCGALVVLVILGVVASFFWLNGNKEELSAGVDKGKAEGQRFGPGTDEAGCETEAKRRAGEARSFGGQMEIGAFFRACLESSRESPGYCDNVPPPTAIRRSVTWQTARCSGDTNCGLVVPVIQTYCTDGRPKLPGMRDSTVAAPDSAAPDSAGRDSAGY